MSSQFTKVPIWNPNAELPLAEAIKDDAINKSFNAEQGKALEVLTGRHVIIVEDIIDTGRTMKRMVEALGTRQPASVSVCTLLMKPEKLEVELDVKYCALQIPNDFIVGYGLDFDQQGRGLRDIYTLVKE